MSVLEHVDPIMQILPIDNGYLLVISPDTHGGLEPKIIYAKTEIDIAEEIIAAQARHKLDIEPKQGKMFEPHEMRKTKNV